MADRRGGLGLRLAAIGAVWLGVVGAASAMPGCYGRNCDSSLDFWGDAPGEGQMLDDVTWQSNPVEGGWLPLPGNRIWVIKPPVVLNRRFRYIMPYVSGSAAPLDAGQNFTVGSGNSTVIVPFPNGEFWVQNTTCADYFLRVQFELLPAEDDGGTDAGDGGEAGVDPDAGIRDASND